MNEPTAPLAGSDDEFRARLLTDAWATARLTVEGICARIMQETSSPAFLAQSDVEEKHAKFAYRRFMEVGIEALYVCEFMFATGLASGALDPQRIAHARTYAQQFVLAATRGQRAYCKSGNVEKPCRWEGLMEEAGPAMLCPSCGQRTLDLVTIQTDPGGAPPGLRLVK